MTAIFNLKSDHHILGQILELYMNLSKDGKDIVFISVPGHVGMKGNSAADSAKDALDGDISVELIPFSDLNQVPTNIYYNCGSLSGMSSQTINRVKYFQL